MVCSAGNEAKRDNGAPFVCGGCEKGFYKETEGVELCIQCNENFTTVNTGAMRSSDCDIRKENYLFLTSSSSFASNFRFTRNVFRSCSLLQPLLSVFFYCHQNDGEKMGPSPFLFIIHTVTIGTMLNFREW